LANTENHLYDIGIRRDDMWNYKVYNDVERKMIHIDNGHRILVDFIFLEKDNGKASSYLAYGHDTVTNKKYGWVELFGNDPIEAFVGYVEATDNFEKEEYIQEFNKKYPS